MTLSSSYSWWLHAGVIPGNKPAYAVGRILAVMDMEGAGAIAGLCADCRFAKVVRSDRGATFYQCGRSFEDPRFSKYPRLPVRVCAGYETEAEQGIRAPGFGI